jgi:hypothetical protein
MLQKEHYIHEFFDNDDTVEVEARIYQGDHGHVEIAVEFLRDGAPADLSEYVVAVTNRAPNGDKLVRIGGTDEELVLDGNTARWTLQPFDTQQVGTYTAQLHVSNDQMTLTAVFIRYNVERSVGGNMVMVPVQFTSLSVLAEQVKIFQDQAADLQNKYETIAGQYDLFQQILDDSGISWETLPDKPESYPPSEHFHEQYELKTTVEALDDRVVENADAISALDLAKADKAHVLTGILWAADWQGDAAPYTQTIDVPGMKRFGLYAAEFEGSDVNSVQLVKEKQWGYIGQFKQEDGKVTAICSQVKPGVDFRLQFFYLGSEVEP